MPLAIVGTLLCAIALGALGADQAKPEPAPIVLTPSSSKTLEIPGFSFSGNAQCDAKGNVYFHTGFDPNDSVIFKVQSDGSSTAYRLAGADADETYFVAFRVNPDGKLWLLDGGRQGHEGVYLFEFGEDPSSPARRRLEAPDDLNVQNFLVLRNDHVLLEGYFDERAKSERRGHSYFAEFEASGKLIRESSGKISDKVLKDLATRAPDASAAQGDNGLVYFLESDKVTVVSPTGQETKDIRFSLPEPGYRAYSLYIAGGRLLIGFLRPSEQKPFIVARYALFDASTGEQLRLYEPGPDTGNNLVCFSDEGLTFYRVEHGRVKLVTAAAN
jgi:hypothetical protein